MTLVETHIEKVIGWIVVRPQGTEHNQLGRVYMFMYVLVAVNML